MQEPQKDYFTSREAAELLGVAVSTIQLWTNNGLLRAWTTGGGHRRIACDSVNEMLAERKELTTEQSPEEQISIVIVEDDEQLLRLYKKQLNSWNSDTQVVAAKDGYEGLVKIGRVLPDVIISDLVMPNLDGFQMIRALTAFSELERSLIIVISGLPKDEIEKKGGLPDRVHLFTKPVHFDDIERLLRQKKQMV